MVGEQPVEDRIRRILFQEVGLPWDQAEIAARVAVSIVRKDPIWTEPSPTAA